MPTTLRLLNVAMMRCSNLILDVHADATTFNFGTYNAQNSEAIPQLTVVIEFTVSPKLSYPFAVLQCMR